MATNYNDLLIKDFLQIKLISELEPDPLIRKMKMLAQVTGKELDEIESLPLGELVSKIGWLDSLESLPTSSKLKLKFKLRGKRFTVKWRQQDLTGEQYIDSSHFCKEQALILQNIHLILASITVERTWYGKELPYNGNTHKDRADLFFNQMKIKDAYPIMLFFCKYYQMLTDNIEIYLIQEAQKVLKETAKHLQPNGDGSQQ